MRMHLLQSEAMKERLIAARKRDSGVSFEEAREKLGICPIRL